MKTCKMNKQNFEKEYGKTKLDHVLSYIAIAFGKILEGCAWLMLPLVVVQQLCFYGMKKPDQMLALFASLLVVLIPLTVHEIKQLRKSGSNGR